MKKYGKYGEAAVCAIELIHSGEYDDPREAWEKACAEIGVDPKKCTRSAYLGLCEEGKIKNVNRGVYSIRGFENNKKRALLALNILRSCPGFAEEKPIKLWKKVIEKEERDINHDSQMHVVLALFEAGLTR